MANESLGWELVRFEDAVNRWIAREAPNDDVQLVVLAWILGQAEDPYRGMRREEGFDNLWFGPIRGTQEGWQVVTCSYWIHERGRIVEFHEICTLSQPI